MAKPESGSMTIYIPNKMRKKIRKRSRKEDISENKVVNLIIGKEFGIEPQARKSPRRRQKSKG